MVEGTNTVQPDPRWRSAKSGTVLTVLAELKNLIYFQGEL
jgi:hypothetical protein